MRYLMLTVAMLALVGCNELATKAKSEVGSVVMGPTERQEVTCGGGLRFSGATIPEEFWKACDKLLELDAQRIAQKGKQ